MTKYRLWKKQEKRIVKLLYQKGFLIDFKLDELYWNEYNPIKSIKRKHGRKYRGTVYAPEVHYSTVDYLGECDEHSVVGYCLDIFYWSNVKDGLDPELGWPVSNFKFKGRQWFINYLEKFPTKIFDSKINKVLKMRCD